ncbi:MAG: hypothetical protein ABI528_02995 [bacterium]
METLIWVIASIAVVVIVVIYIITSVGKYSNDFAGKFFDEKVDKDKKDTADSEKKAGE